MKKIITLGFLLLFQFVQAQTAHHFTIPGYIGSGAYSKRFTDVFSFVSNPAVVPSEKAIQVGVYAEKKFLLNELNQYVLAISIPAPGASIGILSNYVGFANYSETQVGVAYAKNLGAIHLGTRFNYSNIRIAGYGTNGFIHADIGMIWQVSEKLFTGVHLKNIVFSSLSGTKEEKPGLIYTMGIGYEISEAVFLSSEINKEESNPLTLLIRLQYKAGDRLTFRAGINTLTASPFLGAGWKWNNIRLEITGGFHPQLGVTPGLLLIFVPQKKQS